MSHTAAILGATGMVGTELLRLALADDRYRSIRTLQRRKSHVAHDKLDERLVELDRIAEDPRALAVDHVFCCLGTTIKVAGSKAAFRKVDFEYPLSAAQTALAAGAKQFLVVTAVGASSKSSIFYNRVKGELEDALRQLAFPDGVTVFHPSILVGDRKESRPREAVGVGVMRATRFLFAGPLMRYRAIDADAVARAMLRAASEPAGGFRVLEGHDLFALAQ
jgi:uncharacterized protein YbjT (DUF2867 family)